MHVAVQCAVGEAGQLGRLPEDVVGPRFGVLERQRVRTSSWLLALVIAAAVGWLMTAGLKHRRAQRYRDETAAAVRSGKPHVVTPEDDVKDDDPNQVDVIATGDAADAPEPATRRTGKYSPVHPTILIRLPRFGQQEGLIPGTDAGKLLYAWLAAFNRTDAAAMAGVLPEEAAEGQMALRQQTGGLRLLSAREVVPGVLVFRLEDVTPEANEALGTLVMRPGVSPPEVASFRLRMVPVEKR